HRRGSRRTPDHATLGRWAVLSLPSPPAGSNAPGAAANHKTEPRQPSTPMHPNARSRPAESGHGARPGAGERLLGSSPPVEAAQARLDRPRHGGPTHRSITDHLPGRPRSPVRQQPEPLVLPTRPRRAPTTRPAGDGAAGAGDTNDGGRARQPERAAPAEPWRLPTYPSPHMISRAMSQPSLHASCHYGSNQAGQMMRFRSVSLPLSTAH